MSKHIFTHGLLATLFVVIGCHDGPLYALKVVNPYFRNQWAEDERIGVTDRTRMKALRQLVDQMPSMNDAEQASYQDDLTQLLEKDRSAQSRFLVMQAARGMRGDAGLDLLARGLRDEDVKVRIGACQALGARNEPRASEILVATTSSDAESSVRLAAVSALANHQGQHVIAALRASLQNKDPAFQLAAMESLEKVTRAGIGNDAAAWVAYLDQGKATPSKKSLRDRWF